MKTIVVLGAVIEKDGMILLARRGPGRSMAGKWEFPGGKLEAGETEKECLRREILEELRVETEVGDFLAESSWDAGDKVINLKCYSSRLLFDNIRLTDHDAVVWVKPDELLLYNMTPADTAVAKKLAAEKGR
jgi:mutator protein MutT